MPKAEHWIEQLQLQPHPEGGWFREVYRAETTIPKAGLSEHFNGERAHSTSIYFLLAGDEFSALHRINQDELWHFYDGDALTIHVIDKQGQYIEKRLGRDLAKGESFQHVVEAGDWFGASVPSGGHALVGCTVAPGFDFADFEMAVRHELLATHPRHKEKILRLTREG